MPIFIASIFKTTSASPHRLVVPSADAQPATTILAYVAQPWGSYQSCRCHHQPPWLCFSQIYYCMKKICISKRKEEASMYTIKEQPQ